MIIILIEFNWKLHFVHRILNVVIVALRMFNIKLFYSKKQLILNHRDRCYSYSVSLRCRRNIVIIFINCNNYCRNYSILRFSFKKRLTRALLSLMLRYLNDFSIPHAVILIFKHMIFRINIVASKSRNV